MFITPAQIRMGRALLDWTSKDLAGRIKISPATLSMIESGQNVGSVSTLTAIYTALVAAGVEFTPDGGVRPTHGRVRIMEGHEGIKAFFDIVYEACVADATIEIIQANADETLFGQWLASYSPVHLARMSELKQPTVRAIIKKGDKNVTASAYAQYRWMDGKYFGGVCLYKFGRFTGLIEMTTEKCSITLIENDILSGSIQRLLELAWDKADEKP